jgi:hypothetical protein
VNPNTPPGLLACALDSRFERLQVLIGKRHEESLAIWPAPPIPLNAADQPLAIVVDLDQRV